MHALNLHHRRGPALGLAGLLALLAMLVAAPELATVDLSLGGGAGASPADPAAAPAVDPRPAWLTDPLASPLGELGGGR